MAENLELEQISEKLYYIRRASDGFPIIVWGGKTIADGDTAMNIIRNCQAFLERSLPEDQPGLENFSVYNNKGELLRDEDGSVLQFFGYDRISILKNILNVLKQRGINAPYFLYGCPPESVFDENIRKSE